jgi:iron complex outermembrane receptor protein
MLVPNPVGGFPPMKNMNSGAFTHFGAELELRYRIHPGLTVDASYAYLNMDTPKIAAPVHQAQAGLSFAHGRFDGSISAQAIAGLYTRLDNQGTDNVNEEAKQGFLNASARINFRMNRTWSLFLSGNNLLNSTYETNYGYPMPGISWMVGFRYRLNE